VDHQILYQLAKDAGYKLNNILQTSVQNKPYVDLIGGIITGASIFCITYAVYKKTSFA